MKTYEVTEVQLRELWELAKAGEHVPQHCIPEFMQDLGFESKFVENGHGGYWILSTPPWLNKTRIAKYFLFLIGRKVLPYGIWSEEEARNIDRMYKNLKI